MMLRRVRRQVHSALQAETTRGSAAYYINSALAALILLSIANAVLEGIAPVAASVGSLLRGLEYFCLATFSLEYLLRLWACVEIQRYTRPLLGRLRYAFTPMALIDLVAIAPAYLPSLGVNLITLRGFRLLRLLRLLKFGRYSDALQLMGRVLRSKRAELASTAVLAGFLLILAAALLHAAEGEVQPARFGTILDSMWWAVVTMTTVGYGDVYPQTPLGKLLGSIVAFLGVGLFALPTGILGAGFLEEAGRKRLTAQRERMCPHCGGRLEP